MKLLGIARSVSTYKITVRQFLKNLFPFFLSGLLGDKIAATQVITFAVQPRTSGVGCLLYLTDNTGKKQQLLGHVLGSGQECLSKSTVSTSAPWRYPTVESVRELIFVDEAIFSGYYDEGLLKTAGTAAIADQGRLKDDAGVVGCGHVSRGANITRIRRAGATFHESPYDSHQRYFYIVAAKGYDDPNNSKFMTTEFWISGTEWDYGRPPTPLAPPSPHATPIEEVYWDIATNRKKYDSWCH